MKIAVLLSSYNGEKYIETQIESILAQQCKDSIDLWVRDDGSTDGTQSILRRYAEAGKLQWYTGGNLGPAHSFLDLVKHCRDYDCYAFADQDDFWQKDKVSAAVQKLSGQAGAAAYFCNAELVDADLEPLGRNVYVKSPKLDFRTLACAGGILGCTIVINKRLAQYIQEKELPGNIVMHDFYVILLCLSMGGNIVFDPKAHMKYRQHGNNVVGVSSGLASTIKSRLKDILNKPRASIAEQAEQILRLYGADLPEDRKRWLEAVRDYNNSFWNRGKLACSRQTKYVNFNMGLKLRLSILLGNR